MNARFLSFLCRSAWLLLLGLWLACGGHGAMPLCAEAQAAVSPFRSAPKPPKPNLAPVDHATAPVMLEAREIGYDRVNAMVVARGNVEVVQGDQILQADQITYQQSTDTMRADGHVRLLQPDGNVLFSDHVELKRALKTGIVENFRARMIDNSVFAAREARRLNGEVTVMDQAVYSPCKLEKCVEDKRRGKDPLWQIRAEKIRHDSGQQEIAYKNAQFEVYGVPILYSPYLRHATPDADAQRGFLVPSYSSSTNLGLSLRAPYYVPIAPNQDTTLTPIFTTKEGPVLAGQYRYLLDKGYMELNGSITDPDKRDAVGNRADGNEIRGHVAGYGNYQLDSVWNTGFQLNRTTDDTYMRRYGFGSDLTLTSRLFAEGVKDRTHAIVQGVTFQGLEATDDPGQAPYVVPLATYQTESAAGWNGSRWRVEANTMALTRTEGTDTQRLSSTVGWRLPAVTSSGHIFEVDTQLRADAYNVSDYRYQNSLNAPLQDYDGAQGRAIPQGSVTWRYPLQRPVGSAQWVLEPLAGAAISPNGTNDPRIPNEDSQVVEFTDTNLFSFDRYPGLDLTETGARAYYGLRNQILLQSGSSLYALAGQSYHSNENESFPFTSESGDNLSDYIGLVGYSSAWLNTGYRVRLSEKELELKRQEATLQLAGDFTNLSLDYVDLTADQSTTARNELSANLSMRLSQDWTGYTYGRRDLNDDRMVGAGTGLIFSNECVQWMITANRTFTRDRDIQPDTSFTTQIFLKNIN